MANAEDSLLPHGTSGRAGSGPSTSGGGGGRDPTTTSSSLLEQLVYIDNFMSNSGSTGEPMPNLDIDGQLSLDLAAFADDSFVFPDESKRLSSPFMANGPGNGDGNDNDNDLFAGPNHANGDNNNNFRENHNSNLFDVHPSLNHIHGNSAISRNNDFGEPPLPNINVDSLPKWPVPPGAKSSLESAGLSQSQIELLSALVAQHQQNLLPIHPPSPAIRSPSITHSIDDDGIDTVDADTTHPDENVNDSELDKRRRNTAASARFRIKKKMKEKQMENKLQSLNDMIKGCEGRAQQLEMENKLLKNLIIAKGSQKSEHELKLLKERARQ